MRAPTRPATLVRIPWPSMEIRGPEPQGSENVALGASVAGRRPASAGIASFDRPTGRLTSCPVTGCVVVAYWTTGKLMLIWVVRSGGTISVSPSSPISANLVPCGLVILMASGAAAKPGSGLMIIRRIVRMPRQLSPSAGLPAPAIHEPGWFALRRLAGARLGRDPQVELAVTATEFLRTGVRLLRTPSSCGPGTAIALAASL